MLVDGARDELLAGAAVAEAHQLTGMLAHIEERAERGDIDGAGASCAELSGLCAELVDAVRGLSVASLSG